MTVRRRGDDVTTRMSDEEFERRVTANIDGTKEQTTMSLWHTRIVAMDEAVRARASESALLELVEKAHRALVNGARVCMCGEPEESHKELHDIKTGTDFAIELLAAALTTEKETTPHE